MAGLPQPDFAPGARKDLSDALHELHHRAGWPSLRALAREAGCSHTTVSQVFSADRLPNLGVLELLVEAMHGDVETFRDLWLAASAPAGVVAHRSSRIAGRRTELAAIQDHVATGRGRLLLISGEAGIGKSRLVMTAAQQVADDDTFVAMGVCLPLSTQVPLLPVSSALRAVHGEDRQGWFKGALDDCPPYVGGALTRLLPEVELLTDVVPEPSDDWSRQRLFSAIRAVLTALAGRRRLTVVIEDLHWADSATLDLVEFLVSTESHSGATLIGTYRTDDADTAAPTVAWHLRTVRLPAVEELVLGPLSLQDTVAQLELLTGRPADPALIGRIYRRTQGHPLFTEQLAAAQSPSGPGPDAHREGDEQMPGLLAELLDQRLHGLSETAWTVARTLGIADSPLSPSNLDMVELPTRLVTEGLRELGARRLLAPNGLEGVRLRHPLLAEAIRRRMGPLEMVEEHRRLATAMAGWEGASPAVIAEHWKGSAEAGPEIAWRILAGEQAAARFAANEEADQWLRVLQLWPSLSTSRDRPKLSLNDIYLNAMSALHRSGRAEEASTVAEEALVRLADVKGRERAVLCSRAGALLGIAEPERGLALLEAALGAYQLQGPSMEHVYALQRRADLLRGLARYDEAGLDVERAADMASSMGDFTLSRRLLATRAWHAMKASDLATADLLIDQAESLTLEGPDPLGEVWLSCAHTDMLLVTGGSAADVESAARKGLEAVAAWELDTINAAFLRSNVSQALVQSGQVERALELVRPFTEAPHSMTRWAVLAERAHLETLNGRPEPAGLMFEELEGFAITPVEFRTGIATYAAERDLWLGQPRRALDRLIPLLTEALTLDVSQFLGAGFAFAARAAADVAHATGRSGRTSTGQHDLDRLRALRAQAKRDPFDTSFPVPADRRGWGATWSAELARLAGASSPETWAAAAHEWDLLRRPHDAAYCRWRGAQAALAAGQANLGNRLLRRAARDARGHLPLRAVIAKPPGS